MITIWLTGLSGAGKTTTADALIEVMKRAGLMVEGVDGDRLRKQFVGQLGFSKDDRFRNVQKAIEISKELNQQEIISVVSMISPYREMRAFAREELKSFIEVFVDCPLEECERRDVKGLYAKARRGEISCFTGISDPYEAPENPELRIDTLSCSLESNVQILFDYFKKMARVQL